MSILERLKIVFSDQTFRRGHATPPQTCVSIRKDLLAEKPIPKNWHPSTREELEIRIDEARARYRNQNAALPRLVGLVNKTYRDRWGYVRYRYTNKLVHREVAEQKMERPLESWEFVHHIDGDKCNNAPENLLVCSWEDHNAIHRTNVLFYGSWHKPKDA